MTKEEYATRRKEYVKSTVPKWILDGALYATLSQIVLFIAFLIVAAVLGYEEGRTSPITNTIVIMMFCSFGFAVFSLYRGAKVGREFDEKHGNDKGRAEFEEQKREQSSAEVNHMLAVVSLVACVVLGPFVWYGEHTLRNPSHKPYAIIAYVIFVLCCVKIYLVPWFRKTK